MRKPIASLQYLTQDIAHRTHEEQVYIACEAGVKWIQLRVKNKPFDEWKEIAKKARQITNEFSVTLIINDNAIIAEAVNADGVHLGREDVSCAETRKILGNEKIIGYSTHSLEDVLAAANFQVDYFGLGPFRFTSTKEKLNTVLGFEGVKKIIQQARMAGITKPIIAIGGIQLNDVQIISEAGADGIAVSSAINHSTDPTNAARDFLKQLSQRDSFRTNNFKLQTEA
jgi:thiamine-phosphate pyrophosphorylase